MRAHSVWTAAVIAELEADPQVRARLPLVATDALVRRGDRLVVAAAPHGAPAYLRSAEVSLRCTAVVELIVEEASQRARTGAELVRLLDARFPGQGAHAWDGLLTRLLECGLLVSALRPDAFTTDDLAHVLDVLHWHHLADLPQVGVVERIRDRLTVQAPLGPTRSLMRQVSDAVAQPVTATMRVSEARLPGTVAEEAASAAAALWRASPTPCGSPWARRFHDRFVGRYGTRALVPVVDLVDSARGLGMPDFTEQHGDAAEVFTGRDRVLLDWAHRAAVQGAWELVVTEEMLDALTAAHEPPARPAPHLEVCAHVLSPTREDLAAGRFELWTTGIGSTAMTLTGRFLDLLDDEHRQALTERYATLPTTVDGAKPAQLAFAPLHPHLENVTRTVHLLPGVLSVGGHHGDDDIRLADLAVTADQERLFLVSLSRRCVVEPVVAHAAARTSWPPLARMLWEIARSGTAGVALWSWGSAASGLPFLPRVRYHHSVLSPAQWWLDPEVLPSTSAPRPVWEQAVDRLREQQGWPRWISVGERDRLLTLDLDAPMDRAVLRDHLNRTTGTVVVSEAPDRAGHGWNNGNTHEVVVPLACTLPPTSAPPVVSLPMAEDRADLPGRGVLTVHLEGAPDQAETILTRHLPDLITALGDPSWWFVRYRHPGHHLRLRLHHDDHPTALHTLHTWARDLYERGLLGGMSLHTYRPETARYGTGEAMRAAETVFAADSVAARAQLLALDTDPGIDRRALAAASMVHLARSLAPTPEAGEQWLLNLPRSGPALPREALRHAVQLTDTAAEENPLGDDRLARAWKMRAEACAHYARTLTGTPIPPERALVSLLHLHHNRACGIDPDREELITRMARAVALSRQARRGHR